MILTVVLTVVEGSSMAVKVVSLLVMLVVQSPQT